jgi:hypothetical protein
MLAVQATRRYHPSMVIERHLTRNRQQNAKRVRRLLPILPNPRPGRPENDRVTRSNRPLAWQIDGSARWSFGELQ